MAERWFWALGAITGHVVVKRDKAFWYYGKERTRTTTKAELYKDIANVAALILDGNRIQRWWRDDG